MSYFLPEQAGGALVSGGACSRPHVRVTLTPDGPDLTLTKTDTDNQNVRRSIRPLRILL